MNKKDLVSAIAEEGEITKDKAGMIFDMIFNSIEKTLKKGDEVSIPGFGKFKVTKRKAREGRNPATGKQIKIPAMKVPRFTAAKNLKEAVAK